MARDIIHKAVKQALINDGWTITKDPFRLDIGKKQSPLEVDLAAERLLVAEKESEKILVEVKTFANKSTINQFHGVLGQYLNYKGAMLINEIDRTLYISNIGGSLLSDYRNFIYHSTDKKT